jgi:hypothetical protein
MPGDYTLGITPDSFVEKNRDIQMDPGPNSKSLTDTF